MGDFSIYSIVMQELSGDIADSLNPEAGAGLAPCRAEHS